ADGAYFGVDVSGIVDRLVTERLEDGGWNCERAEGSTRSSFDTTINVLEGLLEDERATGPSPEVTEARRTGKEFLLERSLYKRLSTGTRPMTSISDSSTPIAPTTPSSVPSTTSGRRAG